MKIALCILFSLILTLLTQSFPQQSEKGDPHAIKEVIFESNNIKSVFFNYGAVGKPNYLGNIADMCWNNLGYMFEFGTMLGGEVLANNGDTLRFISDSHILSGQGDYSPDLTKKWGWLPRPGYANPNQNQVANSNNPDSWPSDWTGWKGEYGDGVVIGLNEAYYVMDDFTNAEYPYYPFPGDTTKRGFGVKAEIRVYQFGEGMRDVLILKYKLTNESPKQLNKLYFGFMGDPHIGGAGDYNDDRIYWNSNSGNLKNKNTAYFWDDDMMGMGGLPTGYLGMKFLQTPENKDLTSLRAAVYTNALPNVPKNDPLMWEWFTNGIDSLGELFFTQGDNVVMMGTGPFSLSPGETKEVAFALFLAWNLNDLLNLSSYIQSHYKWFPMSGINGGNNNYKVNLLSPVSGVTSGIVPVTWSNQGSNPGARIFIEYSRNKGDVWSFLADDIPVNSQSYLWNTSSLPDGVNYQIRIVAYNPENFSEFYFDRTPERFTINNPGNAIPEASFISDYTGHSYSQSPMNIGFFAEDADNEPLKVSLEYRIGENGAFVPVFTDWVYASGIHSYNWNFTGLPNSSEYYLRLTVKDDSNTVSSTTKKFAINEYFAYYLPTVFNHISGNATPEISLKVTDPSLITGNNYQISFNTGGTMNIRNLTSGNILIENYPVDSTFSTPVFEGLKLLIKDRKTELDLSKSRFNRTELNNTFQLTNSTVGGFIPAAQDWIIAFNNLDTLANGQYLYPGDTVKTTQNFNAVCPFRIISLNNNNKANYIIQEQLITRNNGKWDIGERIILRADNATGAQTSYQVSFNFPGILPQFGDSLFVYTYKSLTNLDIFTFVPDNSYLLSVKENIVPGEYSLFQNYPNPFNPSTVITYELPVVSNVSLRVFDILGNEVAVLVNEEQQASNHLVTFNAGNLSTGVYFYRLQAGEFVSTKKLVLMK